MALEFKNILLKSSQEGVYTLTFNRPKQLNALSRATIEEFGRAVSYLADNKQVRALLIAGAGEKAFVAGADISEFVGVNAIGAHDLSTKMQGVLNALESLPIPVVAVINGYALGGGCEVALACDWIIASDSARFGQPEVNLGIMPGFGGSQRLTRCVGKSMALDMCLTGRMIDAVEAQRIGIVNQVVPQKELAETAAKLSIELSKKPPLAIKYLKEVIHRGANLPLNDACALEAQLFGLCFSTEDQEEGVSAFLEKREPSYSGS